MPPAAIERLRQLMRGSRGYLEFGSGGSTLMAAEVGVPFIVSVESDGQWAEAVRRAVSGRTGHFAVLHADIGPTGAWGHPNNEQAWRRWHRYPLMGWEACAEIGIQPDLILIDGRFRVACFLGSLLFGSAGAKVLIDDYVERPNYSVVEGFCPLDAVQGRMAEFTIPGHLDRDAVWRALLEAVTDKE